MFREIADIQTADMLKLPVPEVRYHNIKTKPSEIQKEMVAGLAKRAEKVRARLVKPNIDNMLKITNDGRKLALDQRMIDPMLPDDPDSKVNTCVDNVYRIWEEHADTKAAQLVFCDLSTPKMTALSMSMTICGKSSSAVASLRSRCVLSMKRLPMHRKKSCLRGSEVARCVYCLALPRKWEQVRMCRTGSLPSTI